MKHYEKSLKQKLKQIREMGWIPSLRRGNTGVGYTLEEHFGVEENNDSGADLYGEYELKARRKQKKCKTSAFTQAPIWHEPIRNVIRKFGNKVDDNPDRINWYPSLSFRPNPSGLRLKFEGDTLFIVTKEKKKLASMHLEVIKHRLKQKLKNTLMVYANTKRVDHVEHFYYDEAYLCKNISVKSIKKMFINGTIVVEPRCHLFKSTNKLRDRGMAFRLKDENLRDIYGTVEKII